MHHNSLDLNYNCQYNSVLAKYCGWKLWVAKPYTNTQITIFSKKKCFFFFKTWPRKKPKIVHRLHFYWHCTQPIKASTELHHTLSNSSALYFIMHHTPVTVCVCRKCFQEIKQGGSQTTSLTWKYINVSGYSDQFSKLPTKGHWPLDDLWPHICWSLMCDSTQGSLYPSPMKIHQSMWIQWPFLQKTWFKGHWPLDDLWPHICWGHRCDSTQGSLCPSPMWIHQCMWIQWSILQITTYIHILRTTYRMSDHIIVSFWTTFRRDKNWSPNKSNLAQV